MSSGGATYASGLYSSQVNLLRYNPVVAHALPDPDETWTADEVPDLLANQRRKFQAAGLLEVVSRDGGPSGDRNVYRTKRHIHEYVRDSITKPRTMPCGHAGLRNLGDGRYTCQRDACDAGCDRETAREAIFG